MDGEKKICRGLEQLKLQEERKVCEERSCKLSDQRVRERVEGRHLPLIEIINEHVCAD